MLPSSESSEYSDASDESPTLLSLAIPVAGGATLSNCSAVDGPPVSDSSSDDCSSSETSPEDAESRGKKEAGGRAELGMSRCTAEITCSWMPIFGLAERRLAFCEALSPKM